MGYVRNIPGIYVPGIAYFGNKHNLKYSMASLLPLYHYGARF